MYVDKIMIAGVDETIDMDKLLMLEERFPFVEWGVLFSTNNGRPRYPSFDWIESFCQESWGYKSAHFCGKFSRNILEKGIMHEEAELFDSFDSVQLNYGFNYSKKWDLKNVEKLLEVSERSVILQYNKGNAQHIDDFINSHENNKKLRVLYDASGGRGTEIESIEVPTWYNYTGYAGGINPDNIERILKGIESLDIPRTVWVDLESGVRDDDNNFSFEKAYALLSKAEGYIS